MAVMQEDGKLTRSPDEWPIESHSMVLAAFDDLRCAILGVDQNGAPFVPNAKYITDAFSLLATGLECPVADFADCQDDFTRALESDAASRASELQAALDKLSERLGFTPEPPTVLATFKLTGKP